MSNLDAARFQMAFSLAFHMIFAALGVGLPFLMFVAEGMWLYTKQEHYRSLAKTWAKATGILFAIGAVSGTALAFEMGLLWPGFMAFAGSTVGPAFTLEGYAFFLEAIFLGLYLYGWDRLPRRAHWLSGLVVALSGAASSVLVVASNAWMQNPVGADLLRTSPESVTAAVLFQNPQWAIMAIHSTLSCYAAAGFSVAGVYAWGALRGRADAARRSALSIALGVGVIAALSMPVTGHVSAQVVAERQPAKLAAMEAHFETSSTVPLLIGGLPNPETRQVKWAIRIPGGLSFLAFNDPNAEVTGLDRYPEEQWPNVVLTHISFQVMVGAGMAMIAVGAWWAWTVRKGRQGFMANRKLMWALLAASPLGFIALEAGWIVSEVGRQPWIIHQVMRTSDAVTPAPGLQTAVAGFVLLYSVLAVALVWLLSRLKHIDAGGH